MTKKISFSNKKGLQLPGFIDGKSNRGIILCSHFTGSKEVIHLYHLSKILANEGLCALRFDFGDCIGDAGGKCEDMSVSAQVEDVISAIDFMETQGVEHIGLFGHSLGGLTALATAAKDKRIKALVVAASPAKLEWDTVFREKEEEWKNQGYVTFPSWKRGTIKINYSFYEDLKKHDGTQIVELFSLPLLIIHPKEDKLVSVKNAQGMYAHANQPKRLEIIEGANHMFTNKEHEKEVQQLAVDWFKRWL